MNAFRLFPLLLITVFSACEKSMTPTDLQKFAATEVYPDDQFMETVQNKKALVIVAHDDDDCAMSGTIAKLTSEGWQIRQLSLQSHMMPGKTENPAGIICEGNEMILDDGLYRIGLDTMKAPYLPLPYDEIQKQFLKDKIASALISKVNAFNPSIIFTLDDVKGGYGHPEHIFMSQLVKELFETNQIHAKRIYQSVFTNSMETEIVDKWLGERMKKWGYPHASSIANELYGIDGMPEPNVQVNITSVADKKMLYLRSYDEDVKKNLRKFIPYYEEFDATTYFGIFDREFFRVIEKTAPSDMTELSGS